MARGDSRVSEATHARESGIHINLDKLDGVNAAHNPRTARADSLKLTEQGLDRLQAELDRARERLKSSE